MKKLISIICYQKGIWPVNPNIRFNKFSESLKYMFRKNYLKVFKNRKHNYFFYKFK